MVDSLLQLSGIRHELSEIEPPLMKQGLSLNVEVKCCLFCARTRDNIVNIRGVEKESNKCFIALQEILQMVSNRCVKQKRAGRHPKHNSRESKHSYLRISLGRVINPEEPEDITITSNNRNHEERLL